MIRWAVVGSGNMASLFLRDCQNSTQGRFTAVYSHNQERAETFAREHELESAYSDLDQMLASDAIDAVYIASTHPNHAPQAIKALQAGKHVLVEKPMALSESQTRAVFDAARQNNCFCAEALWTKFSPTYQSLIRQLREGRIGDVRHVSANFAFTIDLSDTRHRLLNPEHAGGALLDIGLYTLFLPMALMGEPTQTTAVVTHGEMGVDLSSDVILEFGEGRSAALSYRFDAMMPMKATISGSKGWVELEAPFFAGNALHWGEAGKPVVTEHVPLPNRGWGTEFDQVNTHIAAGDLEASVHTQQDSLQLARLLESLRREHGPIFPFES
ncbi:Gfo/Idh/MocA family protein [Reinekea blandensis]|uniref:Putative oxidoreductase n=1 Tax=Reinekea blandensis MED297 TaxID=314283 RepID=A4BJ85_9GAMM|nr:Gfo/Idh/MocA family oxidoreductase [Reinekea blandensis]EAR07838.1 putative oxidoreductase [Reinekea sp. MED297] [Reinekea blandensis MED297]